MPGEWIISPVLTLPPDAIPGGSHALLNSTPFYVYFPRARASLTAFSVDSHSGASRHGSGILPGDGSCPLFLSITGGVPQTVFKL